MAWWHRAKPGDKVVCVAEATRVHAKLRALSLTAYAPMKGHVYTIKTINHWLSDSLLTLHELDNSHLIEPLGAAMEPGISVAFFRPVQRQKADLSIFTDMLRSDEREREDEYRTDIAERMRLCLAGPDERKREIAKRRGDVTDDAGPLFGGAG